MENNKKLILFDESKNRDFIKKTNVEFRIEDTDEVVFKGSNKIIIAGSAFTASNHFGIEIPNLTPTYNQVMQLDHSASSAGIPRNTLGEKIMLFSIGTDGCGVDQHQVKAVNYGRWCNPAELVPFRVVNPTNDLSADLRNVYFGRKPIFSGTKIAYYFKKFEAEPIWYQRYVSDGTPVGSEVYSSHRTDEIESFIELKLKISLEDCKEFFEQTVGINHTKINTISLLLCWQTEVNGIKYYQDIRPVTKINFPNEPLFSLNKGLDVIYQVFY